MWGEGTARQAGRQPAAVAARRIITTNRLTRRRCGDRFADTGDVLLGVLDFDHELDVALVAEPDRDCPVRLVDVPEHELAVRVNRPAKIPPGICVPPTHIQ